MGETGDWRGLLADVERAATRRGRASLGRFAIEGTRLHERALRSGRFVERALAAESFLADPSPRLQRLVGELRASGCDLRSAPDPVLERVTGGRDVGRVVGLVALPAPPDLERLAASDGLAAIAFLVAVDVEDPGNCGALVRTALAGGASAFVALGTTDPYHPQAVRTSMGSLFRVPVLASRDTRGFAERLARLGVERVGAVAAGGRAPDRLGPPIALFVGGESRGLGAETRAALDSLVTIPMASEIDSYSINAAAAILLHEVRRAGRLKASR